MHTQPFVSPVFFFLALLFRDNTWYYINDCNCSLFIVAISNKQLFNISLNSIYTEYIVFKANIMRKLNIIF